nr:MAG TPA: hypothetical protein [Caudoviricetes sp.]
MTGCRPRPGTSGSTPHARSASPGRTARTRYWRCASSSE